MCVVGMMCNKERRKSGPARPGARLICVGDRESGERKTREVTEESETRSGRFLTYMSCSLELVIWGSEGCYQVFSWNQLLAPQGSWKWVAKPAQAGKNHASES